MKEERWKFTDEKALKDLWKDYGLDMPFKDFKKWVEAESNRLLEQVKDETTRK